MLILLLLFYFLVYFIYLRYKEITNIIKKKIKFFKEYYFPEEPEVYSFWYFVITSKRLLIMKLLIYNILAVFILIIFFIYRFIWEHESLVLMVFIIIFCSTLFYIFCW